MPGQDGRGPMGNRRVGRGLGNCGGGLGLGQGPNSNNFYGRRFISSQEEKDLLKNERNYHQKELEAIDERLSTMDK